jgi:hypothetical protein
MEFCEFNDVMNIQFLKNNSIAEYGIKHVM